MCIGGPIACLPLFGYFFTGPVVNNGHTFALLKTLRFGAFYNIMLVTFVMTLYNWVTIALMRAMFRYHRLEYKRHKNRQIGLYLATIVSLVISLYQ